jgi:nucleotide-binding universal stress UspA family protein
VLGTDGSQAAAHALAAGLTLLARDVPVVIATVIEPEDPTLVTGTGIAGGTMSTEAFDELMHERNTAGEAVVRAEAERLGLGDAETRVLLGAPGPTLCEFAKETGAVGIVLGSRGRGGLKRALLGSVSDFVVRNAPCPVVVVNSNVQQ